MRQALQRFMHTLAPNRAMPSQSKVYLPSGFEPLTYNDSRLHQLSTSISTPSRHGSPRGPGGEKERIRHSSAPRAFKRYLRRYSVFDCRPECIFKRRAVGILGDETFPIAVHDYVHSSEYVVV